ncbi:hypothetical protein DPMN_170384 [Dreissena polymorpha]|uniref:Uncharacterized protein n=1 Tax=Dreissena polymorpha TaxID=45954 RepID=A0A9D4DYA0_DREPO|nr:hypothetical protein DPMN_170384 [Dreissena polymorpha]
MFLLYDSAEKFFISSQCTPAPDGLLGSRGRLPGAYLCRGQVASSRPIKLGPTLGPVQLDRIPTDSVSQRLGCLGWLQLINGLWRALIVHMIFTATYVTMTQHICSNGLCGLHALIIILVFSGTSK